MMPLRRPCPQRGLDSTSCKESSAEQSSATMSVRPLVRSGVASTRRCDKVGPGRIQAGLHIDALVRVSELRAAQCLRAGPAAMGVRCVVQTWGQDNLPAQPDERDCLVRRVCPTKNVYLAFHIGPHQLSRWDVRNAVARNRRRWWSKDSADWVQAR
ncbi:hypothetical protein TRVL_06087 [Trypanosoma vivax]|nr:hypothetical protein TRVL_06087 [Trypanosoma vivax]